MGLTYQRLFFFFALFFQCSNLFAFDMQAIRSAQTESEAIAQLPGQELTLPFIIAQAALSSDSFQAIMAQTIALEVPKLRAQSLTSTSLFASGTYQDNRLETGSPFSPSKTIGKDLSFGVQKTFSSGTTLTSQIVHDRLDQTIDLPDLPGGSDINSNYNQTRLDLGVEQELWRNAFGIQIRKQQQIGKLQAQALRKALEVNLEDWSFEYTQIFYRAWLAQQQVLASQSNLRRKQRLLEMTRVRLDRGTAERPDLLQAQSAVLDARSQLEQNTLQINEIWRGLVIGLNLPSHWVDFDPMLIPLNPHGIFESAAQACGSQDQPHDPPEMNATSRKHQLEYESAMVAVDIAKDQLRPRANFFLNLSTNAVDEQSTWRTIGHLPKVDHNALRFGINVNIPLERFGEQAELREALARKHQSQASFDESLKGLRAQWINQCDRLHTTQSIVERLTSIFENQNQRARLEEERFRIGRVSMNTLIQAGDDVTFSELNLRSKESELMLSAWQILRLNGQTVSLIEEYIQSLTGEQLSLLDFKI